MSKLAFVCPGQGSQKVGMGTDLRREFPIVGETFAEADESLGTSLSELCAEGPQAELTLTANAQPALMTMSVAIARVLGSEAGISPVIAAGHSLGEWSAWVIVGALEFSDALRAVRRRGEFMQEAVPPGLGAMSAILGADPAAVREMCTQASAGGDEVVVPANLNGGGQIVVAGHTAAVGRLEELAKARKHRTTRLEVSAPFHSPLMEPAARRLGPVLEAMTMGTPRVPVVSNVEARACIEPGRIAGLLEEQVTSAVRWEECALALTREADAAVEIGPGRVLSSLMRRIDRGFVCRPTGDVEGVRKLIEEFRV